MTSMTPKSAVKIVQAVHAQDYAGTEPTASTESLYIDTKGFQWATFVLNLGVLTGTSVDCKVQESSDNFSSDSAADVTGAAFTQLLGASDDDTQVSLIVDLSKTERYLTLTFTFTAMTVTLLSASCILSGAHDAAYIGTNGIDANALGPFPV